MDVFLTHHLGEQDHEQVPCKDAHELSRMIDSMSWQDLSAILVRKSENDFLEGSGSHDDGFSLIHTQDGRQDVTPNAPDLQELKTCLIQYFNGEPGWREMSIWQGEAVKPLPVKSLFSGLMRWALIGIVMYFIGHTVGRLARQLF